MDSIDWIIINKSLDGSLNDQESEILSEWLAESAEHRALYQKIKAYDSYSLSDEKFEQWRSEYTNVLSRLGDSFVGKFLYQLRWRLFLLLLPYLPCF